jgi:hypothetical protein
MLIKLSGDKYVNPERIACIVKRIGDKEGSPYDYWVVCFDADNNLVLTQKQMDELQNQMFAREELSRITEGMR